MEKEIFDELIAYQQQRLLRVARRLIPSIAEEDLLQPFDFPQLEQNAEFRYEEGVLSGILMARAAVRSCASSSE